MDMGSGGSLLGQQWDSHLQGHYSFLTNSGLGWVHLRWSCPARKKAEPSCKSVFTKRLSEEYEMKVLHFSMTRYDFVHRYENIYTHVCPGACCCLGEVQVREREGASTS